MENLLFSAATITSYLDWISGQLAGDSPSALTLHFVLFCHEDGFFSESQEAVSAPIRLLQFSHLFTSQPL
jgi:hypothetical protein